MDSFVVAAVDAGLLDVAPPVKLPLLGFTDSGVPTENVIAATQAILGNAGGEDAGTFAHLTKVGAECASAVSSRLYIPSSLPVPSKRTLLFIGAGAALGVVGGIAAPFIVLPVLGFYAKGVLACSLAALWQASIGNVAAGSLFASLQSAGAVGVSTATLTKLGAVGSAVGGSIGGSTSWIWSYFWRSKTKAEEETGELEEREDPEEGEEGEEQNSSTEEKGEEKEESTKENNASMWMVPGVGTIIGAGRSVAGAGLSVVSAGLSAGRSVAGAGLSVAGAGFSVAGAGLSAAASYVVGHKEEERKEIKEEERKEEED